MSRRKEIIPTIVPFSDILIKGLKAAYPIWLGYIPLGIALGVVAQKAGFSFLEIGMMSIMVFAGSAQFIAISMVAAKASIISIIITTFVVNLRHFLMSSSLSMYVKESNKISLTLFSHGVTDETFAINMEKFVNDSWNIKNGMIVNFSAYFVWVSSTTLGGIGGQFISSGMFGIDYALIAMFIGLLVLQLKGRIYFLTGVLAGIFGVIFSLILPGNIYIIIGSVFASFFGVLLNRILRNLAES